MLILGIDPGSRTTGFGVIDWHAGQIQHVSHGVIKLPIDPDLAVRLAVLAAEMQTLLQKYKAQHIVVEKIFLGKNADSAFKLGHARGVVLAIAAQNGKVFEYATRSVKKAVGGSGAADKDQVRRWVCHLLRLQAVEYIDASDALAMAIYHGQKQMSSSRLNRQYTKEVSL